MAVKFEPEQPAAKTSPAAKAAPDAKAEPVKVAKAEPKAKPAAEVVARAGGFVDRGDGDGWVIEEDGA